MPAAAIPNFPILQKIIDLTTFGISTASAAVLACLAATGVLFYAFGRYAEINSLKDDLLRKIPKAT